MPTPPLAGSVHLDLDEAWPSDILGLPTLDARAWGPRVRYHARDRDVESFLQEFRPRLTKFVLYGSGDFHHLAGMLIRRVSDPFVLVSFDNHPDWDVRPPFWSCGGWAARALRQATVRKVSVWGCGNFELRFPSRVFADRAALRSGKLEIHPWAERQPAAVARRFDAMTRGNWRDRFAKFADRLAGQAVYVTVDLDCLRDGAVVTNWENGLFEPADIAWALQMLQSRANLVAADVCGAYSPSSYERWFQRFAGNWDHPKLPPPNIDTARQINATALQIIWPALTGASM